jgi:hypothetical protein
LKEKRTIFYFNIGVTVFAFVRGAHFAAQHVDHKLQAVTDAKHGQAEFEYSRVGVGGVLIVNRAGTSGQNDSDGRVAADFVQVGGAWENDGKDVLFTDAARNELGILRPKVEDND